MSLRRCEKVSSVTARSKRSKPHQTSTAKEQSPPKARARLTKESPARKFGPWSPDEDASLRAAVAVHGAKKWPRIAELVVERDSKQCRERWANHLMPSINHEPFAAWEDELVWRSVRDMGPRWSAISREVMTGRTYNQIKLRYVTLKRCREMGVVTPPSNPRGRRCLNNILICFLFLFCFFVAVLLVSIQLQLPMFRLTFFSTVIDSVTTFAWSEFVL